MEVDLFIPCFVDHLFPETGFNMVRVLEKFGCTVHYNTQQTCCGQPAFKSGYRDEARIIGKKFLKDFSGSRRYIVAPGGACIGYIRKYYKTLFHNSAEHNKEKQVNNHLFEFTEFLVKVLHVTDAGATFNAKATFHDGCGALHGCGVKTTPRQLLHQVNGLELIEMETAEVCCGFGGVFSLEFEPIATRMASQKVAAALDTGAEYMISTDLSCFIHLNSYLKQQQLPLKNIHIADVLASGW